jgi:hypothetical protein
MNSAFPSTPSLASLYARDRAFGRAARATIFGLIVAIGMKWASQGITYAPDAPEFEKAFAVWAQVVGLGVSALGAIFLVRRHLWVKKVFTRGIAVKGTVENLENHDIGGRKDSSGKPVANRIYYATVRYEMHGRDRQVSLRLPNSGFVFGLKKGDQTDLMVHDSAPEKPLIRAVYLGRS